MEDDKLGYDSYIWFMPDYWGVPKVSYRPPYSKVLWWMYGSQDKAWSMFQGGGEISLYNLIFISGWGPCSYHSPVTVCFGNLTESSEAESKLWRE